MYEQVFNFNARPFTSTPYVKHYFPATAMAQAVGQATICIQRGSGPVVAIGDIGTGKSLLLAKLSVEHQSMFQIVNVDCSRVSNRKELLQNILFQLGKPVNMDSETELRFAVIESANPTAESPEGLLVLADDAETLTVDVFEEMRTLTNIVVDGSPQVRLVLAGRRALEERLADPSLASFSQRIASRVFLNNLSRDDTSAYVVEHINRVGGNGQTMFADETVAKLHELTDGCPRLINQVCDFVLILAATRGESIVSACLIEEAWNDVQSLPMGSGTASTLHESAATKTSEQSEWTLIEFGQLDDDSPQPTDATVYDFENSVASPEPAASDSLQHESPLQEEAATQNPSLEEPQPLMASGIDSELGIDLGSLQAMQDAAAASEDSETSEQDATEEAARLAMEQQLLEVFGAPTQSTTPSDTSPKTVDDVSQSNQSDGSQQTEVDRSGESDSLAGLASAAALVGGSLAGAAHLSQQTPSVSDQSQTTADDSADTVEDDLPTGTVADAHMSSLQVDPVDQKAELPGPVADPNSFVPATQPLSQLESMSEVQAEQNATDQTLAKAPTSFASGHSNQNDAGSTIESGFEASIQDPQAATEDPFKESFATEKTIAEKIVKDSGDHNQNALQLSSADLTQLQPLHNPTPDQPPQVVEAIPSDPTSSEISDDAAATSDTTVTDESAKNEIVTETEPTSLNSVTDGPGGDSVETQPTASTDNRGFSILSMSEASVTVEPEASQGPIAHSEPSEPQQATETESPSDASISASSSQSPELSEQRDSDAVSDEISRKADEILARLRNNSPELKQEQQILSDIRQQQQIVSDSQLSADHSPTPVPISEVPEKRDDSEMLVVNPDTSSIEKKKEPEMFPLTDSPISSGRAARMDYEQLFDRLRNLPEENQE